MTNHDSREILNFYEQSCRMENLECLDRGPQKILSREKSMNSSKLRCLDKDRDFVLRKL